jgi:hypothetical protein
MNNYYESPTGEQWTKEQWEQYVAWEEARQRESSKHDCDDCNGCQKCEA